MSQDVDFNPSQSIPTETYSVLIVDDSPIDGNLAAGLLARTGSYEVEFAMNGVDALDSIRGNEPDIVLTDLQMPELDGLGLVESIRNDFPSIPVVLMTAHGSEAIAAQALLKGAASYVPKTDLGHLLPPTVRDVLAIASRNRRRSLVRKFWKKTELEFVLENDTSIITPVLSHIQDNVAAFRADNRTNDVQIGVALHEALRNAMHHGNLELDSELRRDHWDTYYNLAIERTSVKPYADRRVVFRVTETPGESRFFIRDEGRGFDTSRVESYDPGDPENLTRPSGRGLFLIKMFMDQVYFNDRGNEITMIQRVSSAP